MDKEEKTPNQRGELWRMVKFLFFSVSAGLIELLAFTLLTELTDWPYWPCYLPALVLSVLWNFTLNRKFTFHSAANVPQAMFKVFCYYLVFTPSAPCWATGWRTSWAGTSIWSPSSTWC